MKHKHLAVRSMLAWLLLAACVILAVGAAVRYDEPAQKTWYDAACREVLVRPVTVKNGEIPVNTADAALLEELPGVGPATAENILLERELNGPFYYPEDLMHVSGIGEKKLDSMRDLLDLTEE